MVDTGTTEESLIRLRRRATTDNGAHGAVSIDKSNCEVECPTRNSTNRFPALLVHPCSNLHQSALQDRKILLLVLRNTIDVVVRVDQCIATHPA